MYVQGFIVPVPAGNQQMYTAAAEKINAYFGELGAIEIMEAWEDDVRDGQHTDFRKAVNATADEKIVFSWIIWPDKATCEAAHDKMMNDGHMEMSPDDMPFDGKRMIYGGFSPIYTLGRD